MCQERKRAATRAERAFIADARIHFGDRYFATRANRAPVFRDRKLGVVSRATDSDFTDSADAFRGCNSYGARFNCPDLTQRYRLLFPDRTNLSAYPAG